MQTGPVLARRQRRRTVRPLILADHRHVHNAVNTRDERAAERRQKVFALDRAHIVPEQIHGHPPRKRKKPDKEQTFQSAPYPAAVSLNDSPSERSSGMVAYAPGNVKRQFLGRMHPTRTSLQILNSTDRWFSGILSSIYNKGGVAFIWILTAVTIRVII